VLSQQSASTYEVVTIEPTGAAVTEFVGNLSV
jgi:hypothetical protein